MNRDMTAFRLISFSAHGAFEMLIGLVTLVAPFLFGFGVAGAVISIAIGLLAVGLALSTTDSGVAVGAHYAFDYGLTIATLVAALLVGLAGDSAAVIYLACAGVAQLALNLSTRYSVRA